MNGLLGRWHVTCRRPAATLCMSDTRPDPITSRHLARRRRLITLSWRWLPQPRRARGGQPGAALATTLRQACHQSEAQVLAMTPSASGGMLNMRNLGKVSSEQVRIGHSPWKDFLSLDQCPPLLPPFRQTSFLPLPSKAHVSSPHPPVPGRTRLLMAAVTPRQRVSGGAMMSLFSLCLHAGLPRRHRVSTEASAWARFVPPCVTAPPDSGQ